MDRQRYRLFVNLGASQVRKRLKGYGLGVIKVESVDRGRSLVLHTATGEHLRRLEALLADVIGPPPLSHSDRPDATSSGDDPRRE